VGAVVVPGAVQEAEDKNMITPTFTNTVFASVGAYPNPEERCRNLIQSAEKFGVPLTWISWGEKWQGFSHHKLRLLRDKCKEWKENGIRYIFMLDSKDVVFVDPVNVVLQKAAEIYEPRTLLFNAEWDHHIYPYKDEHFITTLKQEGCHLNSGMIFGEVDIFMTVIGHALSIMEGIKTGTPRAGIAEYVHNDTSIRHKLDSDQFHYQIASIYKPQYFRLDTARHLFAWVGVLKKPLTEMRQGKVGIEQECSRLMNLRRLL
jgi:hypothetical protein